MDADTVIVLRGGLVYTPSGPIKGSVVVCGGVIREITSAPVDIACSKVYDAEGLSVVPGGIDIHIHGGGGREFIEASEDSFRTVMSSHAMYGATSFLPTLPACPYDTIRKSVEICDKLMNEPDSPVLGLHLEGPYLNPRKAGAIIPEYILKPAPKDYEPLLESTDVIKRWDFSPELPGAMEFSRCLGRHGVLSSLAHTEAEYPTVWEAFENGCTHATHFYNAMTGVHNVREYKHEGTIESVYLIPEMTVEVIADGKHVPPAILRLIYQIKGAENVALVSDALGPSAGAEGGIFDPRVEIHDGVCKLKDHSALAGSIATMDVMIRAMVNAGVPFEDVIRMSAETPARIAGALDRKGTLEKGKDADIAVYDKDFRLKLVMQRGKVTRDSLSETLEK